MLGNLQSGCNFLVSQPGGEHLQNLAFARGQGLRRLKGYGTRRRRTLRAHLVGVQHEQSTGRGLDGQRELLSIGVGRKDAANACLHSLTGPDRSRLIEKNYDRGFPG